MTLSLLNYIFTANASDHKKNTVRHIIMERVLYIILEVFVLLFMGCDSFAPKQPTVPFTTSSDSNFDLIFKYGIGAKNELDTFKNTYTKDLVVDPSIAVNITLSKEELGRIYQKMIEIDFFGYPNKFSVSAPPGEIGGIQTPYGSYYFMAKYDSKIKELRWEDEISLINEDEKTKKLRELIKLIRDIIESKEEYKKLPYPRGAYL